MERKKAKLKKKNKQASQKHIIRKKNGRILVTGKSRKVCGQNGQREEGKK